MKNIVYLLLMLINFVAYSAPIDSITAKKVALFFLETSTNTIRQKNKPEVVLAYKAVANQKEMQQQVYYYIYNVGENAYVIVSGTDQALPVLGYSNESSFDPHNIAPNVKSFLSEYEREIAYLIRNEIAASSETTQAWNRMIKQEQVIQKSIKPSVAPLIKTKWSQSPYYNALCPYDSRYGSRAVTGCVATAMAQIMNYWSYPSVGFSEHSYVHHYFGNLSADFKNTTYRYDLMPITLTHSTTNDSVNAVATLMYHCGVAVEMNYGVSASGAYVDEYTVGKQSAEYAMRTYFGYSDVQYESRYSLGDVAWTNLLKQELSANRPLLYRGQGSEGGHAFICDGYDASGYFHFNWGWNGSYDGYFLIGKLNPGSYYDFTNYQGALYNIIAPNQTNNYHLVLYDNLNVHPQIVNCKEPFTMTTKILNNGNRTFTGDLKASVLNAASAVVAEIEMIQNISLSADNDSSFSFQSEGVSGIAAGAYKIRLFYRNLNDTVWVSVTNIGSYVNETVIQFEGDIRAYTDSVTNIDSSSAKVYASLIEGCAHIISKGFKWKKQSDTKYTTVTISDSSLFEYQLSNLQPNTTYTVMAHLITYSGSTYGNVMGKEITFTTAPANIINIEESNVKIYPNPAKNSIHIAMQSDIHMRKIELINTIGQVVKTIHLNNTYTDFSVTDITQGIYIVKITGEKGVIFKKIGIE